MATTRELIELLGAPVHTVVTGRALHELTNKPVSRSEMVHRSPDYPMSQSGPSLGKYPCCGVGFA